MSDGRLVDFNLPQSYQHLGSKCFHSTHLTNIKWKVHPMVIFTILDSYMRREEGQHYVLGTLLGVVCEGNTVEITDSFVDRHSLTDEGLLQIIKDHHENMYELKQKINPKEQVVGWFCTGSEMTELTCAVHGWFKQFNSVSKFYPNPNLYEPVHLLVDATCESGAMAIKAYVQLPLMITKDACFQFHEVDLELLVSPSDTAGSRFRANASVSFLLKSLDASKSRKPLTADTLSPNTFGNSLLRLKELIDRCIRLVEDEMENTGERRIYPEIGRFLLKTVSTEKLMSLDKMEKICELSLQDNLMVGVGTRLQIAYLANLANLQFALSEHLNSSF